MANYKMLIRQVETALATANRDLSLEQYKEFLEEVVSTVEGRLEGLEADEREAE